MTRGSRFQQQASRLALPVAALLILIPALAAVPQQSPLGTIDEDCTAFTFGRDGRMAFAVRHVFNQHKFTVRRDDFWIGEPGKGKHRILNGDKLSRGEGGFSYGVRELRWSPGLSKLTAELLTTTEAERHGSEEAGQMVLLLDANGLEIKIADGDSMISESENAAWLDDESTVVYLAQETKPRSQFSIQSVRPAAGHPERLFPDTLFFGVAWEEHGREAVAVAADAQPRGKPRLVLLDLAKQTVKELAMLDGFTGGLKLSPSEKKVSYFRDPETLEVRVLANPLGVQRVRTLSGTYFWTQDEQHVLMKSGPERRSGIIEALRISDGNSDEMFHGLTFWNFGVSPDGRRIGVSPPGKHVVNVYALEGLR